MKSIACVLILISVIHIELSGQWEIVNETNIDTTYYIELRDVCFIDRKKGFVLGGEFMLHHSWGKVFMTENGGQSWMEVLNTSDDQCPVFCHFTDNNNGYIGSYGVGWLVGEKGLIMKHRLRNMGKDTLRNHAAIK